jgi:uncharacterized integral membrane protein
MMDGSQLDFVTTIYFVVGFVIVLIFSANYYNHPGYPFSDGDQLDDDADSLVLAPALPKYMTGRFEYNLSLVTYVLAAEFIYVLLAFFLPDLQQAVGGPAAETPLTLQRENIVLATLIITGIAPNLPYVRGVLDKAKLYLHEKAQIPRRGRDVFRRLNSHTPAYSPSAIEAILADERFVGGKERRRLDLDATDFESPRPTIEGAWAKLSYLMYFIDRWSERSPLKTYIGNRELQRSSIEAAYSNLQRRVGRHKTGQLSEDETYRLHSNLETTLKRAYRLISCLLYLAGKKEAVVNRYLDELGYSPGISREFAFPFNRIALVVTVVVGSIFGGVAIAWFVTKVVLDIPLGVTTGEVMQWVSYAVPFLTMPIVVVLLLKRRCSGHSDVWPLVCTDSPRPRLQDRPWHIYLLAAMLAYLAGFVTLALGMGLEARLQGGQLTVPGRNQVLGYRDIVLVALHWSWLVFVIGGFSAFSIDSVAKADQSWPRRALIRTGGAVFQGVILAGLTFFIFMHEHVSSLNISLLSPPQQIKLAIYCLNSFLLGVSLNLVANFGRLRQKRKETRRNITREVAVGGPGGATVRGSIRDVSDHGALVHVDAALANLSEDVRLIGNDGTTASAHIVGSARDGTRLHVRIEDEQAWEALRRDLRIPTAS